MTKAKLSLLGAMGIFGTIGIFVRYIPLPSDVIAFCRAVLGLLFLLLVMAAEKKKPDLALIRKNLPGLLLSGAAMGFNWILLFESYRYTTVATATVCYYIAPLLLLLVSPLLGEKLSAKKLLCVGVALLGLICISGITRGSLPKGEELMGIALGLGAAFLYACVMFLNKKLTPMAAYDKTVLQLGSAAVVLFPYLIFNQSFSGSTLTTPQGLALLLVGVLHTGIAYALYFGSLEKLNTKTIAVLCYLDPVIAVILSALLLQEPMGITDIAGTVLILGSALYSELSNA